MPRKSWASEIGRGTEFIPNIPDDPMSRKKNEVTLSKRPRKRGRYWYYDVSYRDPNSDGPRKRVPYSTNETEKQRAIDSRDRLRDEFRKMLYTEELASSDKAPIGLCVEEYLSASRFSSGWDRQVRSILEQFVSVDHIHPEFSVNLVKIRDCEKFCFSQGGTHQPHTAFRILRGFFAWLVSDGRLQISPIPYKSSLGKKLKPAKVIQDYFHEEKDEFLFFFRDLPSDTFRERTFRNLIYLAYATGLRLQDVCNLKEGDIDGSHDVIQIKRQGKTGEPVMCHVSPQVADALALQARNKATHPDRRVKETSWLFPSDYRQFAGQQLSPRRVEEAFLVARRSLLPNRPGLHFHSLRHSFGQNAYNHTGALDEISVAMGHCTPFTTLTHYATNARYVQVPTRYETMRKYLWSRPVLSKKSNLEPITGFITEESLASCSSPLASTISN